MNDSHTPTDSMKFFELLQVVQLLNSSGHKNWSRMTDEDKFMLDRIHVDCIRLYAKVNGVEL